MEHSFARALSRMAGASSRRTAIFIAVLMTFLPVGAFAAEGGNVALRFSASDKVLLWVSLVFAILALVTGLFIWSSVIKLSPGSERMQEVGAAIRAGALAYLKKQFQTMSFFIVLLSVGLYFLYQGTYGSGVALGIASSFIGGVLASYLAGYWGMMAAVNGNMRTANACLTSYKRALETAFRSGAVAGLGTVGIGLLGTVVIFLLAGADSMKMQIGFGFGGSLAALFMRVGGGIYTKAADVGADLVGKIEAGIPEDDPRNPAVIADNVGDNVGDCAGMAADVFESYAVTLVAAVVLGAATATIFETSVWMKLILFALLARGVGIVGSIVGILMMRGKEDISADPLKLIQRGFWISAGVAAALTIGVAYLMMGRPGQTVETRSFIPVDQYRLDQTAQIQKARDEIARRSGRQPWQVTLTELQKSPVIQRMGMDKPDAARQLQGAVAQDLSVMPKPKALLGFNRLDFNDPTNPVLKYATRVPLEPGAKEVIYDTFGKVNNRPDLVLMKLRVTSTPPAKPGQPKQDPKTDEILYGPISSESGEQRINQATASGAFKVEILEKYPAAFYSNAAGEIVAGVEDPRGTLKQPDRIRGNQELLWFKQPPAVLTQLDKARQANPKVETPLPPETPVPVAIVQTKTVQWYWFALCILIGIGMAFVIDKITDYYVSLNGKPVRELGDAATAGPAPMIITGFSAGAESSVYSVFAIVLALMTPLFIFPPTAYGGYILSFYGLALVGLGLLTTTGYILAMDTFGPIADNAQGIFEMSGAGEGNELAMRGIQHLDAAGNTTKALTKGFAIATAVVAAVALFHSYVEEGRLVEVGMRLEVPEIFLGLLIGGAAPYLFSALTINAVGRASFQLIGEVRRQFRNDPGILEGTSKPDYGRCVAIVTAAAQKELLAPGVLAVALPVIVAFGFAIGKPFTTINGAQYNLVGAQALGGFLAGTILSGQLMAVLLANSGGMWDNAKKLIEDGLHGGKGSEAHRASVVCDTVGDPFKDTAGPALNPLIKVMNLVALLIAPVVIMPRSSAASAVITGVALVALLYALWRAKLTSLSSELKRMTAEAAPALGGQ